MKPLSTTQQMLTWLCICPIDECANKWKKLSYIGFALTIYAVLACHLIASAAFVFKHFSTDLETSLYAAYQCISWSPMLYVFMVAYFTRNKITALFSGLSEFYDKIEDQTSIHYLLWANNKSEWIWNGYIKYGLGIFGWTLSSTASIISVLIYLYKFGYSGHFDRDKLYMPFKYTFLRYLFFIQCNHLYPFVFVLFLSLPWNQHTPLGYFAETVLVNLTCESYMIVGGAIMLLYISSCLYLYAFYKIFRHMIHQLEDIEDEKNQRAKLREIIIFHNSIKSWFNDSVQVFSPFIMILLTFKMIALANIVFQMDLELKEPTMKLGFLLMATSVCACTLFVYCYFGKLATESYEKMSDCLYESNWQKQPIKLQKYILLMIQNTQQPRFYHGFGVFHLNLDTYTNLMRAVYTYYMMLKTITSD